MPFSGETSEISLGSSALIRHATVCIGAPNDQATLRGTKPRAIVSSPSPQSLGIVLPTSDRFSSRTFLFKIF